MTAPPKPLITFDLFSALIDSRGGGGAFFQSLSAQRDWRRGGEDVYDDWDHRNKQEHALARKWVPFSELAERALHHTYEHLSLRGDAHTDCDLLASAADWPLWSDVQPVMAVLRAGYRLGILSNVDDHLLASTVAWPLIDPENALTSQRLGWYKPDPHIYSIARDQFGVRLHIAASARDVRGAGEAGLPFVRVARPGHTVDPGGPPPVHTVSNLRELDPRAVIDVVE